MRNVLIILSVIICAVSCSKKVPLDKKQFRELLIDVHITDAMLQQPRMHVDEEARYKYYNDLFKKYGITKEDFDSCVRYYSGQTVYYQKLYEEIIDTLSARETKAMAAWRVLTKNDTVNIFPGYTYFANDTLARVDTTYRDSVMVFTEVDTVVLNTYVTDVDTFYFNKLNYYTLIQMDSVTPGFYRFRFQYKFDKKDEGVKNKIQAYLLSDNNDTLVMPVRSGTISSTDTIRRQREWDYYYSDSTYNRIIIKLFESENEDVVKKKGREGRIWGFRILKEYKTDKYIEQIKNNYLPR